MFKSFIDTKILAIVRPCCISDPEIFANIQIISGFSFSPKKLILKRSEDRENWVSLLLCHRQLRLIFGSGVSREPYKSLGPF